MAKNEGNALLKIGEGRAKRMSSEEAFAILARNDFTKGAVIRHSVSRDRRHETIVTDYHRHGRDEMGNPYYYRARLTETCSI